tara:strand:+ start:1469 stop:1708 length:240 start_codon:yes stop_codon:yes gene_type:complete
MKFIIENEIKNVKDAKQIFTAASALDRHNSLEAKSNVNTLLASTKGIMAAFGAGLTKGLVSQPSNPSKSEIAGLIKLFL